MRVTLNWGCILDVTCCTQGLGGLQGRTGFLMRAPLFPKYRCQCGANAEQKLMHSVSTGNPASQELLTLKGKGISFL